MLDKPLKIEELTASPGMTSVSEVAKGGSPVTGQQEEEDMQHKPGQGPKEDEDSEDKEMPCSLEELQEAYSNLFESLSVITRSNFHN